MAQFMSKQGSGACPYCFVPLDFSRVAFQCSGLPAASRPACRSYPDFVRAEILGDRSPVLPPVLARTADGVHIIDERARPELRLGRFGSVVKCDRCGGPTSVCICPSCHSYLPEELPAGAVTIGVVGARNSGKTVLLSMLDQQLMSRLPSRFGCVIDHPGGTVGLARDLQAFREDMETKSQLPAQTMARGAQRKVPSVYRWKWMGGQGRIISVYDTAGEDVAHREVTRQQTHLLAANALFFVIDPFSLGELRYRAQGKGVDPGPENLQVDVLDGMVSVLRQAEQARGGRGRSGKITTPVAVIVTKMDAFRDELARKGSPLAEFGQDGPTFDDLESQAVHEHLRAQVSDWGGASLLYKLEAELASYRLFPVSSLGNEPDYRSSRLTGSLSPSRVADPLLWILHQEGFVPSARATKG